jgi:hypothetical protein
MNFYVLECIISKDVNSVIVETVGIYSSEHLAEHYKEMCLRDLTTDEKKWMIFEHRKIAVDRAPGFLDLPNFSVSDMNIKDEVDRILIDMVKNGYLEQLIGQDGKFYFELTDKGKQQWPK